MSTPNIPFASYPTPQRPFIATNPAGPGASPPSRGTGAKRGRKPKGAVPTTTAESTRTAQSPAPITSQPTPSQWFNIQTTTTVGPSSQYTSASVPIPTKSDTAPVGEQQPEMASETRASAPSRSGSMAPPPAPVGSTDTPRPVPAAPGAPGEDDGEGEDEMLPAMADDDYSAQLSWQSQTKDNLKVLMDNFTPAQYDRFEAYRRHALPKQAVRKVIQQTLGQQVSQPVAQIVAGFGKVFVGEMVEKARAVQERRGETGPLTPDHLREAYRIYQQETGRVGAARPLRSKRLFSR